MKIKACIDCKYHSKRKFDSDKCNHPSIKERHKSFSHITGKIVYSYDTADCEQMRCGPMPEIPGYCGEEAKLFEQRITIWDKLKSFLTKR